MVFNEQDLELPFTEVFYIKPPRIKTDNNKNRFIAIKSFAERRVFAELIYGERDGASEIESHVKSIARKYQVDHYFTDIQVIPIWNGYLLVMNVLYKDGGISAEFQWELEMKPQFRTHERIGC